MTKKKGTKQITIPQNFISNINSSLSLRKGMIKCNFLQIILNKNNSYEAYIYI